MVRYGCERLVGARRLLGLLLGRRHLAMPGMPVAALFLGNDQRAGGTLAPDRQEGEQYD
jgi:hypothetical protein